MSLETVLPPEFIQLEHDCPFNTLALSKTTLFLGKQVLPPWKQLGLFVLNRSLLQNKLIHISSLLCPHLMLK